MVAIVIFAAQPAPLVPTDRACHMIAPFVSLDFEATHWTERNPIAFVLKAKLLQKGGFAAHTLMLLLATGEANFCLALGTGKLGRFHI